MRRSFVLALAAALVLSFMFAARPTPAVAQTPLRIGVVVSDIAAGTKSYSGQQLGARIRSERIASFLEGEFGTSQATRIGDAEISSLEACKAYDVIVLTRQLSLTSSQRVALRDYVAQGGGLVAMFGAGRWDYVGNRVSPTTHDYMPLIYLWQWSRSWDWSRAWEWGEVSELYQVKFNNDPLMSGPFRLNGYAASSHPILSGAATDLGRSVPISMTAKQSDFPELVWAWAGSTTIQGLLTYGSNHSLAGWTAKYGLGRVVYYGFQIHDLATGGDAYADPDTSRQARALISNSVKWAGDPALLGAAPTYGAASKSPGLAVSAGFASGAVRVSSTVSNAGNTQLRGYFNAAVIDPSGSRRGSSNLTGARIPLQPGGHYSGSWAFSVGSRPAKGRWIVRVGYEYYDYMRGGAVWVYRDVRLDSTGSSMRYAGATTWYSKGLPAAGPGIVGADRYAVAASISATGWPAGPGAGDAVVLATGLKFSDALAASPLAGKLDAPILLTARSGLSAYVSEELKRMYAGQDDAVIYAVGSDYSMPAVVIVPSRIGDLRECSRRGASRIVRIAGADDFALAHAVAAQVGAPTSGPFADTAIIASYSAYADALSISPLAAKHGIPILFVTVTGVPLATQQALAENGIKHCLIVGGPGTGRSGGRGVAGDQRLPARRRAGQRSDRRPDTRLSGATRYDVSVNALKYGTSLGGMDASAVFVASGLVWPDALAAGPLGGKQSHPVLLVQGRDINYSPPAGTWFVSRRGDPPAITFLGGLGTISEYARGQVGRCLGLN